MQKRRLRSRYFKILGCFLVLLFFGSCSSASESKDRTQSPEGLKNIFDARTVGPTQNLGYFKDVTEELGLTGIKSTYMAAVDLNNNGYDDLVFLNGLYNHPEVYFYNPYLKKFLPTQYELFEKSLEASYFLFYDFDKDGVKDALAVSFNYQKELSKQAVKLFKGVIEKGRIYFKRVYKFPKILEATASVIPVDINKDGHLDLFMAQWYSRSELKKDRLLIGKGLSFTDQTEKYFPDQESLKLPSLSLAQCDINNDQWPDILTTSSKGYPNTLWLNKKKIFHNIGNQTHYGFDTLGMLKQRGGGRTQFANCYDFNEDGYFDVFLGELNYTFDGEDWDRSSFLFHQGGGAINFFRKELIYHSGDQRSETLSRAVFGDFNFDGYIDAVVDNNGFPPNSRGLFLSFIDGQFQNLSPQSGIDIINPSQTIRLDFNQDGKVDLLTSQMNTRNTKIPARIYLFQNTVESKQKLFKLNLKGRKGNKEAIGARVEIWLNDIKKNYWYTLSEGFLSPQHAAGLWFGLEPYQKIQKIEVYWPSSVGKKTYLKIPIKNKKHFKEITLWE